jgi:hypothetical protein
MPVRHVVYTCEVMECQLLILPRYITVPIPSPLSIGEFDMHGMQGVSITVVEQHLKKRATGVKLDLENMPGNPNDYAFWRAQLDAADRDRLFLWWENWKHTQDGSCLVAEAMPPAKDKRVLSFIDGNERFTGNVDLRAAIDLEPVIVSNNADSGFLYLIDGSHRVLAQFFQGLSFQDVPVFLCVHPQMRRWAYVNALCDPARNKTSGLRHPDSWGP